MTDPHELGLITVKEAAGLGDMNQSQVYKAISAGRLHYAAEDRAGGLLRREDVERWLRTRPRRRKRNLPTISEYARQRAAEGGADSSARAQEEMPQ